MVVTRCLLLVVLFSVSLSLSQDMNRFSTKSPYNFRPFSVVNFTDFEPTKAWSILRHGTRLPSKKVISRYNSLAAFRDDLLNSSTALNDRQRAAFERWRPMEMKLEHQKFLTKEGEHEHFQLGSRFRKRFPSFFDSNSSFLFKHTPTQRTELSAARFIEGLLPDRIQEHQSVCVERDDPVLRPYKGCHLWQQKVKKNKEQTLKEYRAFEESETVANLVNEFREFTKIDSLTIYDIEVIYTACGFETSWQHSLHDDQSTWCSLFQTERQLGVMEFLEDLKYYWVDGPGYEITRNVACKTVEDIFNNFNSSSDDKKLTFYFTHSGTILKLLTFMGLYEDNFVLTAGQFGRDRKWRASLIDTFSSNLNVIFYESPRFGPHVQLLHQEQVLPLPKCQMNEHGMCTYDDFMKIYQDKISRCNLQRLCHSANKSEL